MGRLWSDEQEAIYRATPRPGGRISGGFHQPADVETPVEERRPTFLQDLMRAVGAIRQP